MGSDQQYTFNNSIISCSKILRIDELTFLRWLKKRIWTKMVDQGRFNRKQDIADADAS